jgi:hypothetical protein
MFWSQYTKKLGQISSIKSGHNHEKHLMKHRQHKVNKSSKQVVNAAKKRIKHRQNTIYKIRQKKNNNRQTTM